MKRPYGSSRSSAAFVNKAVASAINADATVTVQTPVKIVSYSQPEQDEEDGSKRTDALQIINLASFERIAGTGNVVIQIPIFIVDSLNVGGREVIEHVLDAVTLTNTASAGAIEGAGNVVIQIPVLLVNDCPLEGAERRSSLESGKRDVYSAIENAARSSLIRGERNMIIQAPVQLAPITHDPANRQNALPSLTT